MKDALFSDGVVRAADHAETPFHGFLRAYSLRVWAERVDALRWQNLRLRETLPPRVRCASAGE